MAKLTMAAALVCALPVLGALLACGEGGKNANQRGVGDNPGGVPVGLGDIAVAPVGNYVLFRNERALAVGNAESGQVQSLPLEFPSKLAFSKRRPVVYVGREAGREVTALDLGARSVLWRKPVPDSSTTSLRLESSPDDRFLAVGAPYSVVVLDTGSGRTLVTHDLDRQLVDLEILPDSNRVLIVEGETWSGGAPDTRITVIDVQAATEIQFSVPNCAEDIVVSEDGQRAFLAPTHCSKDPVSVLDLHDGSEHFDKNLPGFGPVARAPKSNVVVAFYDRFSADASIFDDPNKMPGPGSERYHLMLIDATNLTYEFVSVGSALPRYALTPNGNVLLVDSDWYWPSNAVRLLDVPTRQFRDLSGPALRLDNFVLSSDSNHAYVLGYDVFDIDIPRSHTSPFGLTFRPTNLNISADDRNLYLRKSSNEICIYDIASRACTKRFVAPAE